MDIFSFMKARGLTPSLTDEFIYEFIAAELSNSIVKQGLWTKALSDSEWNESKAKSLYVKMRFSQLRTELDIQALQAKEQLNNPFMIAKNHGLTDDEIEYLQYPIMSIRYIEKYSITKDQLSKAISLGKIKGVLSRTILWVQDKKIT